MLHVTPYGKIWTLKKYKKYFSKSTIVIILKAIYAHRARKPFLVRLLDDVVEVELADNVFCNKNKYK